MCRVLNGSHSGSISHLLTPIYPHLLKAKLNSTIFPLVVNAATLFRYFKSTITSSLSFLSSALPRRFTFIDELGWQGGRSSETEWVKPLIIQTSMLYHILCCSLSLGNATLCQFDLILQTGPKLLAVFNKSICHNFTFYYPAGLFASIQMW